MCTAATRPPVEETAAFLKALMAAHGKDFLVKVFGPKAKNELAGMGGVDKVAVALSRKFLRNNLILIFLLQNPRQLISLVKK